MPAAIALAGAAFSVTGGLAAGGIIGGLMVAGGALTGLGVITGNKKLTKIGSILSLAGGVGSLGQSLLKETAAQGVAAEAAKEAATATAGNTIADLTGTGADAASAASNVAAEAASSLSPQTALAGTPDAFTAASSPITAASSPLSEVGMGYAGAAPVDGGGILGSALKSNPVAQTGQSWLEAAKTGVGKIADMAKANPEMAKITSGIIGGAADIYGKSNAAKEQMNREMQYRDWVRQRYSDSVRNLTIPPPLGIIGGAKG